MFGAFGMFGLSVYFGFVRCNHPGATMTKFFITHSWKDIEFPQKLCDDLSAHGLAGFFDVYSIQPGDDIAVRVARGLEECDVYVPLLSPAAVESPWCEREIGIAIDLSMEHERKGRPRIVPVIIKPCNLPTILRGILYISFDSRYDDALKELLTKGFGVSLAPKVVTPPRTIINPRDGKDMILIPAGEFVMGSDEADDEKPPHKVSLDAFYIARYPVTNADYKKFVDATKHAPPSHWSNGKIPQGKENHPVVNVSWKDAVAYCEWAGRRLPTEAEWEKAASWDDIKKEKRVYPWGKEFDKNKCNSFASGIGDTMPVGPYSAKGGDSAYGVGDMAGNVWEWCSSHYQKYPYHADDGRENMRSGNPRVLRGGSWTSNQDYARCAYRNRYNPVNRDYNFSFRIAEFSPSVGSAARKK
jgi:formylglycine-generating enzyme required for sulfatase activity